MNELKKKKRGLRLMTFSILCGMVNDIVIDEVIKKKNEVKNSAAE